MRILAVFCALIFAAVAAGFDCLTNAINAAGKSYEAYIFSH